MRLNYKLLLSRFKFSRRLAIHFILGGLAVACFLLAMSPKNSSVSQETASAATENTSLASNSSAEATQSKENEKNKKSDVVKDGAKNESSENWQTIAIKPKDTLAKIFNRHGYSAQDLHQIMKASPDTSKLTTLKPGKVLKLNVTENKQVNGLSLDLGPGSILVVSKVDDKFLVEHKQLPIENQLAFGKGKIQNSLFGSAKKAGLDNKVVSQMIEIFGWNVDFSHLKPNDTFRILFEEKFLEGERIETGNILAAELVNAGKKYQAVRYTDKSGNTGYFSPEGYGMHQSFLRSPLNFTRISSGFGNRRHPILHKMRKHNGVDYSAPKGTPVKATGDAKVIFAGNRRGYGKVIELQHGARYSTLYAHLSKFAQNLKIGHSVKQGQVIGYVGATGLATGPHLHYEFRVDGIHRDPVTVTLPKKNPISDSYKSHFMAHAQEMLRLMDQHESKVKVAINKFLKNE